MKEKKKTLVATRLTDHEIKKLEDLASYKHVSRSDILREALEKLWEIDGKKASDYKLDKFIKKHNEEQRRRFLSQD